MFDIELDKLHKKLSRLRQREDRGEPVQSEINTVLSQLDMLESGRVLSSRRDQTASHRSQSTAEVHGDMTGSAVGEGAQVNADVIAHHFNPQTFSENRQNVHVYSGGGNAHDQPVEVMAGNILADWSIRIYNIAPKTVSVGLATFLPVLLLFSPDTIIIALPLIATVTTIGIYVLVETQFSVYLLKHFVTANFCFTLLYLCVAQGC
jgi:hypothetical protein